MLAKTLNVRLFPCTTFMPNPFQTIAPNILANAQIRTPQKEAYAALSEFSASAREDEREVGVVLPVGCGKSGCIALAPFAFNSARTLVVAPNLNIARQLVADFNPTNLEMFYQKCGVLAGPPYPEPVEIRGTTVNRGDLDEAHVVITNIQQLQGERNRWITSLPEDFFDLILFDEGHHSVAQSWDTLKAAFPAAVIVNFSATPLQCRWPSDGGSHPLLVFSVSSHPGRIRQASKGGPTESALPELCSKERRHGNRSGPGRSPKAW